MVSPAKSPSSRKVATPRRARRVRAHFVVGSIKVPVLYQTATLGREGYSGALDRLTITFTVHGRDAERVYRGLLKVTPS